MKVTNNASFPVCAFGFHTEHGYGMDMYIKPGESRDIKGPYAKGLQDGQRYVQIPGEIICQEAAGSGNTHQVARGVPVTIQDGQIGVVIRHRFDDPEPEVTSWWNREAVMFVTDGDTPPCENPENLICHRCEEEMHVSDFIPNTTCCFGCHEMTVMKETGYGVVTHEGHGMLGLNGAIYEVK